jgi:hypothetical protein
MGCRGILTRQGLVMFLVLVLKARFAYGKVLKMFARDFCIAVDVYCFFSGILPQRQGRTSHWMRYIHLQVIRQV